MTSQGLPSVPSSVLGFAEHQIQNPDSSNIPETQPAPASSALKRKRNLPGTPDPDSEVVALSPNSLMATNRFLCEVCNKGFQRDQNLQLHRRGHNLPWKLKQRSNKEVVKKKVYICPEQSCVHHDPSRALGDLTGIKKHFYRKHGEKKWKCDKCSKKYAVKSDWKAHSKICGTREHKCDCGTLFSRKDSFITHRAFCSAIVDQSDSRFVPSAAAGLNNPVSLRNDYLTGSLGNPQSIETHQFSGGGLGFFTEFSSNFGAHFLMGNPAANLSHEFLLQNAGQGNLFESSSSSAPAPWLSKCPDQTGFGSANMSSLDQIIGNRSGNGVMQVKREDGILSNEEFVEHMTSLYNSPTNLNHQPPQALAGTPPADQFLSSFFCRNGNNSLGLMSSGLSNGQAFSCNNGFAENRFSTRPPHLSKDSDVSTENLNHLMLMHEAAVGTRAGGGKQETRQHDESSQTRDFLGVGGNEITREQFRLSEQFRSNGSTPELDISQYHQQWKHSN